LKDYYLSAEMIEIPLAEQTLYGVRFISKDREPYSYTVAVVEDGRKIHLLEIFLPDPQWDSHIIFDALEEGRLK
ncbi:MAG: hypothetical protein PF447_02075, partial [Spirochaetaceae bacterium]|nr:hypothetical protein [Spirochaetaceae bacterium]